MSSWLFALVAASAVVALLYIGYLDATHEFRDIPADSGRVDCAERLGGEWAYHSESEARNGTRMVTCVRHTSGGVFP